MDDDDEPFDADMEQDADVALVDLEGVDLDATEPEAKVDPEADAGDEADAEEVDAKSDKKKKKDDLKIDRNGDLPSQWRLVHDRSKHLKPATYKMSENYEARTALLHKVLGWGFVLTSLNNRLEVLFRDGIKILIANYKA